MPEIGRGAARALLAAFLVLVTVQHVALFHFDRRGLTDHDYGFTERGWQDYHLIFQSGGRGWVKAARSLSEGSFPPLLDILYAGAVWARGGDPYAYRWLNLLFGPGD